MGTDPIINRPRQVQAARLLKRLVQVLIVVIALAAMLFLSSWRFGWVMAWVFVGVFAVVLVTMTVYQELSNPELLEERSEFRPREGVQTWDVVLSIVARVSLLASYVVAGLDVRFGWRPEIPFAVQIVAFALGLLGGGLIFWAMAANRHAAVYARIQKERGHVVATTGP